MFIPLPDGSLVLVLGLLAPKCVMCPVPSGGSKNKFLEVSSEYWQTSVRFAVCLISTWCFSEPKASLLLRGMPLGLELSTRPFYLAIQLETSLPSAHLRQGTAGVDQLLGFRPSIFPNPQIPGPTSQVWASGLSLRVPTPRESVITSSKV